VENSKDKIKWIMENEKVAIVLWYTWSDDWYCFNFIRVCVEAQLPDNVAMMLDCYGNSCHSNRETMHVQGLSHWAPANIGPYSQCTKVFMVYFHYILVKVRGRQWLSGYGRSLQITCSSQLWVLNPLGTWDSFMWENNPVSSWNVSGSTQVPFVPEIMHRGSPLRFSSTSRPGK
jgi:hypothetical protein